MKIKIIFDTELPPQIIGAAQNGLIMALENFGYAHYDLDVQTETAKPKEHDIRDTHLAPKDGSKWQR